MELSFARALAAAELLMTKGIEPKRISVTAAGDNEPRTISRDPASQARNRRIDVFVIDEYTTLAQDIKVAPPTGQLSRTSGADPSVLR